ncbi:hypothetical protein BDA99DRAFT_529892 [Phascolomyces articulosus]|uniref:TPR-like protein n=1 Tax=Phascolomyces articulosus TaxID=60185 RepID=A0AAD5JKQ3_9FUNG|nr:hypothetical protein BDA99DRAFT_529892 [Phascolomyces articulosus]
MTTTKASQLAKDLEAARCKGNWQAIPELARRYKKYNGTGQVLEQTVLVEATLGQLTTLSEGRVTGIDHQHDNPDTISWQCRLESEQVRPLVQQLESVLQTQDEGVTESEKEFCKVILARCYFETGEFGKTLDIVEELSFNKGDVMAGYGLALFLQARAMKAISHEQTGSMDSAMLSHQGIVTLLNESGDMKGDHVFIEWAEEALYRATLLSMQQDSDSKITVEFIRAYQKLTMTQPLTWKIYKRMVIAKFSAQYLSYLYTEDEYTPSVEFSGITYQQAFETEIMCIHTLYEQMLFSVVQFPKVGQGNALVISFVEQLSKDVDLCGATSSQLRGFTEVLNRAAQRTFNSPSIMRHLFLTLDRIGDFEEAKHALKTYIYLIGLNSPAWEEACQTGEALVVDKSGKCIPVPPVEDGLMDNLVRDSIPHGDGEKSSIAANHSTEHEPLEKIFEVFLTAIRTQCIYLGDGAQAIIFAEWAKKKLEQIPDLEEDQGNVDWTRLAAQVHRAVGSAYTLLARQTHDSTLRSYYEKALESLSESIDLDPTAWETHYQLALLHAEMHDIQQAVQTIAKSLQLNPGHLPSWHLLTLACSCPIQDDLPRALKTCDIGLQESDEAETSEQAEQRISLQVTRSLLLGAIDGPEKALQVQEELFAAYGKISTLEPSTSSGESVYQERGTMTAVAGGKELYQNNGIVVSGSLGNMSETQLSERRRRGLSVSSNSVSGRAPQVDEKHISASRSHDDMRSSSNGRMKGSFSSSSRTRSASTFSGKPEANNKGSPFLTVPNPNDDKADAESIKTVSTQSSKNHHHHHHHYHGLHLFSSRSSSRKSKRDLAANDQSKTSISSAAVAATGTNGTQENGSFTTATASSSIRSNSLSSIRTLLQPATVPTRIPMLLRLRQEQAAHILSNLWLHSASSFLNLGKNEEALLAIEEAENADCSSNSRVWCMFGRLFLADKNMDHAIEAFEKGLVADKNDVSSSVWLARVHIERDDLDIAEGILESVTKRSGWDSAEAWFCLGRVYQKTSRADRGKECMMYALDLESTHPIQPFSVLPCYV